MRSGNKGLGVRVLGMVLAGLTLAGGVYAGSGNYLIVAAEGYVGSAPLTQFAEAKTAMGFNVSVYSVPSGTSNTAIKSYIEGLWGTPAAPDYILLVGDTDGSTSTATTIPHWTGGGSKAAATDLPYACMDPGDDWYPDLFIGRFSVRSVSELQTVVNKSLFVEAGDFPDPEYVKRGAFLANPSTQGMAEPTHDWVIDNYFVPNDYVGIKLYSAQGAGTQDVADAVNQGCLWVGYYGHSGSSGWWDPAFDQGDVQALNNTGLYPVVWSFSCNVGKYTLSECFGETWLRVPDKGAVAVIFPSDYIYWGSVEAWEPSTVLEHSFFRAFFEDDIWELGPAWQAALYHFLEDYTGSTDIKRNFFELYNLLGDPALLLPRPNGFTLTPDPDSQDLCAPPADEAVFTLEVGQLGDFAEPVTLSADGLPPTASVVFEPNSLAPPFTSTMTISGLAAAEPGAYSILVTGTSASALRNVTVTVNLSDGLPGMVTLLNPPDGAVDVARKPTLTWEAASQAVAYDLRIATDPDFTAVVYSTTVGVTNHTVPFNLDSATLYYWDVRARNGCGDSGFSMPYSFTTIAQADYFTEEFTGGGDAFDLDHFALRFVPDGSGDYYRVCGAPISDLPTDPAGGTTLPLGDDDYEIVSFGSGSMTFYGVSYDAFYVGSNGFITFGSGDSDYTESLSDHFDTPRISALFDDLNPSSGGTVSYKLLLDRAVVTWEDVPQYGTSDANTFQVELYLDGEIRLAWLDIGAADAIVGLSAGEDIPDDYLESDLSAVGHCPGDLNCDGLVNAFDIDPFILALTDPAGYQAAYPDCNSLLADIDGNGVVNAFDIDPFVEMLTGG